MELSVIIPYVNEYPQVCFTVQNLICELDGLVNAEIITVNNFVKEVGCEDKGSSVLDASPYNEQHKLFNHYKILKSQTVSLKNLKYDAKLSHWQAKNAGIAASKGEVLLFLDSHVIVSRGSIVRMLDIAKSIKGSIHFQICYMLDPRRLIYQQRSDEMHYSFATAPTDKTEPYNVCVMSTCGMMLKKSIVEDIGGWNKELGIYGGGENYFMYKLATCGYNIMVDPKSTVFHFAEKRGYSWNYDDYVRNTFIAAYVVGGMDWLNRLVEYRKSKPNHNAQRIGELAADVVEKCSDDAEFVRKKQIISIDDYFIKWNGRYYD